MKNLLIIYHTQSGSTLKLAQAVLQGASIEEDVNVHLKRAMESELNDLLWCDAVVFGTPENLGYMSGGLKDFFDRTFYPSQHYQLNLPYSTFISCGNDGTGAVKQIERIVRGYPMRCVLEPIIVKGEIDHKGIQKCSEMGQAFAAGLNMGIF